MDNGAGAEDIGLETGENWEINQLGEEEVSSGFFSLSSAVSSCTLALCLTLPPLLSILTTHTHPLLSILTTHLSAVCFSPSLSPSHTLSQQAYNGEQKWHLLTCLSFLARPLIISVVPRTVSSFLPLYLYLSRPGLQGPRRCRSSGRLPADSLVVGVKPPLCCSGGLHADG